MSTPLTDALNGLITYSNSVTGVSDTTLSECMQTLVAGYQGGGSGTIIITPIQGKPLTTAISSLIAYSNTVTGAGDTTLSECIETLTAGYNPQDDVDYVTCLISNGTQAIDSGVPRSTNGTPTLWEHCKIKFAVLENGSTTTIPFGCGDVNQLVILRNNIRLDVIGNTNTQVGWSSNTIYEYTETKSTSTATLNNNTYTASAVQQARSYYTSTWGVFARNYGGTWNSNSKIKLYEFYVDNGTKSVHLFPCLDPDGVACMWDTVSKTYFYERTGKTFSYES